MISYVGYNRGDHNDTLYLTLYGENSSDVKIDLTCPSASRVYSQTATQVNFEIDVPRITSQFEVNCEVWVHSVETGQNLYHGRYHRVEDNTYDPSKPFCRNYF